LKNHIFNVRHYLKLVPGMNSGQLYTIVFNMAFDSIRLAL